MNIRVFRYLATATCACVRARALACVCSRFCRLLLWVVSFASSFILAFLPGDCLTLPCIALRYFLYGLVDDAGICRRYNWTDWYEHLKLRDEDAHTCLLYTSPSPRDRG